MVPQQAAAAVLLLLPHAATALDNGLALTPPMGWVRQLPPVDHIHKFAAAPVAELSALAARWLGAALLELLQGRYQRREDQGADRRDGREAPGARQTAADVAARPRLHTCAHFGYQCSPPRLIGLPMPPMPPLVCCRRELTTGGKSAMDTTSCRLTPALFTAPTADRLSTRPSKQMRRQLQRQMHAPATFTRPWAARCAFWVPLSRV
jgi:hypothetical protein